MGKQLAAFLVGAAALAFFAAGCGGSSSGETVAKLTKVQYVKKANAICATNGKRIAAAFTAYSKRHPVGETADEAQAAEVIEAVVLPGFRAEVEELQDLPAPRGDEAQIEAMLAKFEAGLGEGEENPAHLFNAPENEFSKGAKLAEAYGLKGCGMLIIGA